MESRTSQRAPAEGSARLGAVIAAVGGVVLIVSLFLTWYEISGAGIIESGADVIDDTFGTDLGSDVVSRTGWNALGILDVFCVFAGGLAIARGAVALLGDDDNPQIPGPMLVTAVGAVVAVGIAYRMIDPPRVGYDVQAGVWLAMLGAAAIVYGSAIALRASR